MGFKEMYEFDLLVNEAVNMVIKELELQLEQEDKEDKDNKICKCQDCILDMAALALNHVRPAYRSSFTGVIYAQKYYNDEKYQEEIRNAVKNAIDKVKKNPSHDI